jgi:hypothetical protein
MSCEKFHAFKISIQCECCGHTETLIKKWWCQNDPNSLSTWSKEMGCNVCHDETGTMFLYCTPGKKDVDSYWAHDDNNTDEMHMIVENIDS